MVSERFRKIVLETFPQLQPHPETNRRWFCFFDLLCFGTFFDETFARPHLVIGRSQILGALGLPLTTHTRDFSAQRFLDEVIAKKVIGTFRYGLHEVLGGRSRYAIPNFPKAFKIELEREVYEFHTIADSDKVHLVTGDRWKATTPAILRGADRQEAEALRSPVPEAQRIIDYLNDLPSNIFALKVNRKGRTNGNIAAAIAVAQSLPDERRRIEELRKLRSIVVQPQPFYGPSAKGNCKLAGNTVRVSAQGSAIPGLKNEIKYALIDGWVTFDLRSSQLAIVSKDWGIDGVREWLSNFGNNIWEELCALFPSIPKVPAKAALKRAVYSVCYGAAPDSVRNGLMIGLGLSWADVEPFFGHRFIEEVLLHRRAVQSVVRKARGANDCFGRWLPCSTKLKTVRSVMAQLSQAQEMAFLLPAIELAKKRKDEFKIVLWEHDGFSVHFTRKDRIESESQRIMDAVNERCSKLGYPTRLERKDSPPPIQPTV